MIPERCDCCDYDKFFIKFEQNKNGGVRKGIYCQRCGKWLKWLNKTEFTVCQFNNIPIMNGGYFND